MMKQNKWVAMGLGFLFSPVAFIYLSRFRLAMLYLGLLLLAIIAEYYLRSWKEQNSYAGVLVPGLWLSIVGALHAFILAKRSQCQQPVRWFNKWWGALLILPALFSVIVGVRTFFYEPFSIPSGSMSPTINAGNTIIVEKLPYGIYGSYGSVFFRTSGNYKKSPNRGEIFVFYPPHLDVPYVMRVVGIPGDQIQFRDKQLIINGQSVVIKPGKTNDEQIEILDGQEYRVKYVNPNNPYRDGEYSIPEGQYFVMGDNRDNSADSRVWGMVSSDRIFGRVVLIF